MNMLREQTRILELEELMLHGKPLNDIGSRNNPIKIRQQEYDKHKESLEHVISNTYMVLEGMYAGKYVIVVRERK